jgi:hypothetical protein
MKFWQINSRFFLVFAATIELCDEISHKKDKYSVERVLVAVVKLLINVDRRPIGLIYAAYQKGNQMPLPACHCAPMGNEN